MSKGLPPSPTRVKSANDKRWQPEIRALHSSHKWLSVSNFLVILLKNTVEHGNSGQYWFSKKLSAIEVSAIKR